MDTKGMTIRVPTHWHGKPGFRSFLASMVQRHRALQDLRYAIERDYPEEQLDAYRRAFLREDEAAGRASSTMVQAYGEEP